jgi:amino acid transporter
MSSTPTSGLSQGLQNRHVTMLSIAGAIGAGLFVGSGHAIAEAGPAVMVSYLVAGLLVVLVMRMLAEMAVAQPDSGSFSTYADRAIGHWAGFGDGVAGAYEQARANGTGDRKHRDVTILQALGEPGRGGAAHALPTTTEGIAYCGSRGPFQDSNKSFDIMNARIAPHSVTT